jgi:hypothetical protein
MAGEFLSVAYPQWEIVISRIDGKLEVILRGSETSATWARVPAGGSWIGLRFKIGVTMPSVDNARLIDSALAFHTDGNNSFWLAGKKWEAPAFENVDDFVARLARTQLLVPDPAILAALEGETVKNESLRTQQRRFARSTGLTRQAILAMERAHAATIMLKSGSSINDTAGALGYSDQPHLTRSLRRFIGRTPGQLASQTDMVQLSIIPRPEPRAFGGPDDP